MNYLSYSNEYHVNIIPEREFSALVHEVFNTISDTLTRSLGPLGSHTITFDGMYTGATKDGYSIFKTMKFHNRYKNMIYNLIKDPCTALNNTVGDGTTTVIALTNFLFHIYAGNIHDESVPQEQKFNGVKNQLDSYYRLPREFNSAWDSVIKEINELIQSYAKQITSDDYDSIYQISYVTSNGNHEISKNIADIYKNSKSPTIKIKNSPTNKSYVKPIIGFNINTNLIDTAYVRNEDLSVEEKDINVLIFNYKIDMDLCNTFIIPLNDILRSNKKKLLIIAPAYDQYMTETVLKQYVNYEYQKFKELNLILSQYSSLNTHQLNDLSIVLRNIVINEEHGKKIVNQLNDLSSDGNKFDILESMIKNKNNNQSEFYELIGTADIALLSCNNGSIFRVNNIENSSRYNNAIQFIENELNDVKANTDYEKQSFAFKIAEIQSRLSQLKMENYIYYVGADTALEKKILEDSVDDVIKCTRSAMKTGIVPGCQLSIIRACSDIAAKILGDINLSEDKNRLTKPIKLKLAILEMISNATKTVYATVLRGPNRTGVLRLIDRWEHMTNTPESLTALREAIDKKEDEILTESEKLNKVFDLETCEYSDKIITSAETDIKILTAASQLIKLLISGNQCLFLDSEVNDTHNENVKVY